MNSQQQLSIAKKYEQKLIQETLFNSRTFTLSGFFIGLIVLFGDFFRQVDPIIIGFRIFAISVVLIYTILAHTYLKKNPHKIILFYSITLTLVLVQMMVISWVLLPNKLLYPLLYDNFSMGFCIVLFTCSMFSYGAGRYVKYTFIPIVLLTNIGVLINWIPEIRFLALINFTLFFMYRYISEKEQVDYQNFESIELLRIQQEVIKIANEELAIANKNLLGMNRALSHDLKSPLRNVGSFTQLLQRKLKGKLNDDETKEYMDFILSGVRHMYKLLDDILDFSRLSSKTNNQIEWIDLNQVFEKFTPNYISLIREGKLNLIVESLPKVKADETRMMLLFQNIIDNGIKYNRKPTAIITIKNEVKDNHNVIAISDNGIGIEPKFHEKIFGIFERLHNNQEFKGTGIGLATCREIIEQFGGKIWVKSETEQGSTFYLQFPRQVETL